MEHIISKIIEIEKSAQQLILDAKNEQRELPTTIQEMLDNMQKEYMLGAKKRIETVTEKETEIAEETIKQMEEEHRRKIFQLDEITTAHINSWVEQIYQNVISPQ